MKKKLLIGAIVLVYALGIIAGGVFAEGVLPLDAALAQTHSGRSLFASVYAGGKEALAAGDTVNLKIKLTGYEGLAVAGVWQSLVGTIWTDVAAGPNFSLVLDSSNASLPWRYVVRIIGYADPAVVTSGIVEDISGEVVAAPNGLTAAIIEETPAPEPPAEVPATGVPVTEVPATEVPVTEVPVTEVPATEVPVTEVPATEVPVTDAPAVTEEPAATEEPVVTEEPAATDEPAIMEEPVTTDAPTVTEEPVATVVEIVISGDVIEPAAEETAEPDPTAEVTLEPEITDAPAEIDPSATAALPPEEIPAPQSAIVVPVGTLTIGGTALYLYAAPSADAEKLMTLDPASQVTVLSQDETWVFVDFQGTQGYVPKINLVMEEPVSLENLASFAWFVGEPEKVEYGDVLTLQGMLVGFDDLPYEYYTVWQRASMSKNRVIGNDWVDIGGANELTYSFTVSEDTEWCGWRLVARITVPDDAEIGK